jgi:hypothetical protein
MTYYFILARRLLDKGIVIGAFVEKETGRVIPVKNSISQAAYPDKLRAGGIEILQGKKRIEILDKFGLWQSGYTGEIQQRTAPKSKASRIEIPVMQFPASKPGDPCPACGGSGIQSMITNRTGQIKKNNKCPECDGTGKIKGET